MEKKNDKAGNSFFAFIASILFFLFLDPYFMWKLQKTTPLYTFLGLILFFVSFLNADIKSKSRGGLFALYSLLLTISIFYDGLNLFGISAILCLLFIPFLKEQFAKKTYDYFLTIYSIVIGISGIVWILSLLDVVSPIGIISPLNDLKVYKYNVYPLLVRPDTFYLLERFCGPFDEPGVIGTISAIILTIGGFNLRDKRLMIVFIVGILSMSMFYYAIVAVYYIVYTLTISNDKKFGFLLIASLAALVVFSMSNELLSETLWSRFMWDEDAGSFAGDNRAQEHTLKLLQSASGSVLFFGMGKTDQLLKATSGEASIFVAILQYGLVFVLVYFYLFASYAWKYKKKGIAYLLFLFVFAACLYQRPFLFYPEYLFLYSLMAMNCGELSENKKQISRRGLLIKNLVHKV